MPPFLNTVRRFLPLPGSDEDMARTPDFNPVQQASSLPVVRALKGRPSLPPGRQFPTILSPMPDIPRPSPAPMPAMDTMAWRPPLAAPEPEAMPAGWRPPLARPIDLPGAGMTPIPTNEAIPSRSLNMPAMQRLPDIPQLPGHPGHPGPPIPDNPIDRARYDYVMEGAKRNPDGTLAGDRVQFGRSGKQIALGALSGLQRGGILGALTQGLTNVISPMTGREQNFESIYQPRLEQQAARQRTAQDQAQADALGALRQRQLEAQIADEEAQAEQRKALAQRALNPAARPQDPRRFVFNTPRGTLDLNTGQLIQGTEPLARERALSPTQQLAQGEMERAAEEGSVEQIAGDSYQGRGGDAYVRSKLPANIREILEKGTTQGRQAYPDEVDDALKVEERAIAKEKKSIFDYVKGEARKKAGARALGRGQGSGSAPRSTAAKGTVGPRILKGIAAKLGVDENEAARQLEADGYTVRRQ